MREERKNEEKMLGQNTNWFDKFAVKNLSNIVSKPLHNIYSICFHFLYMILLGDSSKNFG